MADKNWITVRPNLDPILEPINAIIARIDSILAFLIAVLNVVQTILNILKAFLIGLLNPIRAIVEAIIAEIRQIISDLRQAGLYLSDDLGLFEVQPVNRLEALYGGYSAYEKRMLVRLLDRTDSTRPDFSSSTAVVALFLYISSGDVFALIALIKRVMAFFGKRSGVSGAPFAAPVTPTVALGQRGQRAGLFRPSGTIDLVPDALQLTWSMPSTGSAFSPAPKGFLVHVSTVPDGFGVRAIKKNMQNSSDVANVSMQIQAAVDPATGSELRLFGGLSDIGLGDTPNANPFTSGVGTGSDQDQANRLYFALDQNTPLIPPGILYQSGSTPLGAATWFFQQPLSGLLGGAVTYSCTLPIADLPQKISITAIGGEVSASGEPGDTYYIRVRPVTPDYVATRSLFGVPGAPGLAPEVNAHSLYDITPQLVEGTSGIVLRPLTDQATYGPASAPVIVNIPTELQLSYIAAVNTALAILVLTRPDLVPVIVDSVGAPLPANNTYRTGYSTGLEGFKDVFVKLWGQPFEQANFDTFPRQLKVIVEGFSSTMVSNYMPSNTVLEAVETQIQTLVEFKWSDIDRRWPDQTIWDTLGSSNAFGGVAGNPKVFAPGNAGEARLRRAPTDPELWLDRGIFPERSGQTNTPFIVGAGWSDYCPVLYSAPADGRSNSPYVLYIQFVRGLLIRYENGKVLNAANAVLSLASVSQSNLPNGRWEAHRFLYDVLQPVDALLTDIERVLLAILDGLQGIIDKIIAYIEAVQARIYQIQALINYIRALLNALTLFDLPAFSGLVLVENGTDGIASALMRSGNKPTDGPATLSAGAVVLFGGLPAVFLELIALILAGGG